MKKFIAHLSVILVLLFVGGRIWNYHKTHPLREVVIQRDTIVVVDTIVIESPIAVERRVRDTIFIRVLVPDVPDVPSVPGCGTSGTSGTDSLLVPLPREEVVYEDSTYRAVVSGYQPSLDSISIYLPTTRIETIREVKAHPRWSIGMQAGYGATLQGQDVRLSPYIGVGITYNLWNF